MAIQPFRLPPSTSNSQLFPNKSMMKKDSKKRPREGDDDETKKSSSGLNEIDALFDDKKQQKKQLQQEEQKQTKLKKQKQQSASKSSNGRKDLLSMREKEWKDDGLGGKYNKEGFTGRREDGVKVYKAHLLNQRDFGNTPDCPFDCSCCYI